MAIIDTAEQIGKEKERERCVRIIKNMADWATVKYLLEVIIEQQEEPKE